MNNKKNVELYNVNQCCIGTMRPHSVPVINMRTMDIFSSMTDAALSEGISVPSMVQRCNKQREWCRLSDLIKNLGAVIGFQKESREKAAKWDAYCAQLIAEQKMRERIAELRKREEELEQERLSIAEELSQLCEN